MKGSCGYVGVPLYLQRIRQRVPDKDADESNDTW